MTQMNQTEQMGKNQLMGIVTDFADIALTNDFKNNYKDNEKFRETVNGIMGLFNQFSKDLGITEFTRLDGGYTGDQVIERYNQSITSSWKGKKEKKNAIKKITSDEIASGTTKYMEGRNNLLKKRESKRIEQGQIPRRLEDQSEDNILGTSVYKYDKNQTEDSSSSDDNDDDIIDSVLGIKYNESGLESSLLNLVPDEIKTLEDLDNVENYFASVLDAD